MSDEIDIDDYPDIEEDLSNMRRAPNGELYRRPPAGKKVISLEADCGFLCFDRGFENQFFMHQDTTLIDGDPIENADWKRLNLILFPKKRSTYKGLIFRRPAGEPNDDS